MSQAVTMEERKRRQSVNEMLKHLNSNQSCVIPSSLLRILLDDNMTLLAEQNATNKNIAQSLEILANKLPPNEETNTFNNIISTKLDDLIVAINKSNTAMAPGNQTAPAQTNIRTELKERGTLYEKRVHAQQLSQLYEELLNDDIIPFAPQKYRTHVSSTAKDNEKKHKRQITMITVQTQIAIMRDNIDEWTERISAIDEDIQVFLSTHEEKREGTTRQIRTDEEKATKSVAEATIPKLRHTYDREKQVDPTSDFLLKTKNQQNQQDQSKNFRGGGRGGGNRRGTNNRR